MQIDLSKIEKFYHGELGQYAFKTMYPLVKQIIGPTVVRNKTCVVSAAAFPYMDMFSRAHRLCLQAFHEQAIWPQAGQGHYVHVARTHLPYRAEEIDYVFLLHDIEFAEEADVYLRELWRVLKGEGRLVFVIPNRSGKWARFGNTPFGLGYPYTIDQIEKLLGSAHFTIDKVDRALFCMPSVPQTLLGHVWRKLVDHIGRFCPLQPGIFIITASKHVFAPTSGLRITPATAAEKARQALFPTPKPVSSSRTGMTDM